ncbi:hypothetical protein [Aerolutibacter daejeonensis]|uniref:hypothetical protein n=1 Tax=Aerolutibacter daejeonensis TaxID=346181 RepID=UPI000AE49444|nr:hypothetical protein [Lysobacter daejeonensis]
MSNVVQFLEFLGRDASVLNEADYAVAVAGLDVAPEAKEALLRRDFATLGQALGARATVLAYIVAPEEEEGGKDDESQPDDGGQEGPEHVQEQSVQAA